MRQEIIQIPISQITDDPENPRIDIEEAEEIADSMEANGQLVPITVVKLSDNKYMVENGHRRASGKRILKKRTGEEQPVDVIIVEKLSKEDKLLKRCVIDAQQTNLTVKERDKAWKNLWEVYSKRSDFSKLKFGKMLGTSNVTLTNFIDRMELGESFMKELEDSEVGSDVLSETKGLTPEVRKKVLKMAADTKLGCRGAREVKKVLKDASNTIIDSVTQSKITVAQADKLKGMKEEKQKETIDMMSSMREDVDSVPTLMKEGKIKSEEEKQKSDGAHEYVMKLRKEIMDTVNQIAAIEGTLEVINDEKLDKYFSSAGKKELAKVLDRLNERIKPAIIEIEKQIAIWGN